MDTDPEKLKDYANKNRKFWKWTPGIWHEVVFQGFEETLFKNNPKPLIRYYFRELDGSVWPYDVRTSVFADLMADFNAGDRLTVMRTVKTIKPLTYNYYASKID